MAAQPDTRSEIDLSRYAARLLRRSWLIALGAAVGLVLGLLGGRADDKTVYEARATVYIGQPLTYNSGAVPGAFNANPAIVATLIRGDDIVAAAAQAAGVKPAALDGRLTSSIAAGSQAAGIRGTVPPLYVIAVRGPWGDQQVQAAAAAAADAVVKRTNTYQDQKLELLSEDVASLEDRVTTLASQISAFSTQLASAKDASASAVLTAAIASLSTAEYQLARDLRETRVARTLVEDVEKSRLVAAPVGRRIDARAGGRNAIAYAIAGALVGSLLALILPPLRIRPAR